MKLVSFLVASVLASCDNRQAFEEPDPTFARMLEQRRADPYERSEIFGDGKVMREPPPGAIPRDDSSEAPPITRELLESGHRRFETICAACHGILGDGESAVASRMELRRPPSLHDPPYRTLSGEQLFARITDGYGLMPSYAAMLSPKERWAIVAYIRALQVSRRVRVGELPADLRAELTRELEVRR